MGQVYDIKHQWKIPQMRRGFIIPVAAPTVRLNRSLHSNIPSPVMRPFSTRTHRKGKRLSSHYPHFKDIRILRCFPNYDLSFQHQHGFRVRGLVLINLEGEWRHFNRILSILVWISTQGQSKILIEQLVTGTVKMVHESATRHILINKHLHWVFFLAACIVPNELHQIRMMHLWQ